MDELDRRIVNALQGGFPLCAQPFAETAERFGITEGELILRLEKLLADKILTRFGPLFDAERLGGAVSLCAMSVPEEDFERVAAVVNALPEVAHNYEREHRLNMWFVIAAASPLEVEQVIEKIERDTGYPVLDLPREAEYFLGLRLAA
jgi:DNA-binding Lrp family transcriptional regulator